MPDSLDDAVDARIDAYRPDRVPPFEAVEGRKRRRDRRRLAYAGAVLPVVVIAAALAVVPWLDGARDVNEHLTPGTVEAGEAATWDIDPDAPPQPDAASFPVLVTRVACNSGETGEVFRPRIEEAQGTVVVTFAVAPQPVGGSYDCQGNKPVRTEVQLAEPVGDRTVVDGACRTSLPNGQPVCRDEQRWPPAAQEAPAAHSGIEVDICLSGEGCRALDPVTSDRVRVALGLDTTGNVPTTSPPGGSCRAGSSLFTVRIHYASGDPQEVLVPRQCGPMQVNGQLRPIQEQVRDQVRRAYETAKD